MSAGSTELDDGVDKLRLGGMALANGVLVHGPTSWACAVRTDDGEVKVVAERKRLIGSRVKSPAAARARRGSPRRSPSCRGSSGRCRRRSCRSSGRHRSFVDGRHARSCCTSSAARASATTAQGARRQACSPSRRRCSRCASGSLAGLPRRRAHRDRQLRARRAAREGARALRLAPRRPAPRSRPPRRTCSRRARRRDAAARRAARRLARRGRRVDRDLRLDAAPPRARGSPARSRGPGTSSSTGSRRPSRRRSSSRSPRRRSRPASSSSSPRPSGSSSTL